MFICVECINLYIYMCVCVGTGKRLPVYLTIERETSEGDAERERESENERILAGTWSRFETCYRFSGSLIDRSALPSRKIAKS